MLARVCLAALAALLLVLRPAPSSAAPALVFDPFKGTVVYAEDPDMLWHPASITKLMTAYLVFEALRDGKFKMDSMVTCSANANKQAPSKLGLPVGAKIRVELALRALMVKSANDVAVMLAEKVSGTEAAFVARMNETAKRLGMTRTRFYNPNGLPHARQVTTARDIAMLARALLKEFPEYNYFYTLQSMNIGKRRLRSHNKLLKSFEGADGMKTGFVCASGYNLVASATRDGRKLVAVVFGGRSGTLRNQRAASLLDYGFQRYEWKSKFGESLDSLAIQASLTEGPINMRPYTCVRRKVRRRKRKRRVTKPRTPTKAVTTTKKKR
ncbi:MAG: D-alanyl-D-alanine carboxypeptidase [Hyphomicrobiales bacterium]|nr:D-alanyl-D-alanine carboxypeptidase [Hyphomicrobiales bacterium]